MKNKILIEVYFPTNKNVASDFLDCFLSKWGSEWFGVQCSSFWLCHSGTFRNPDKPQHRSWRDGETGPLPAGRGLTTQHVHGKMMTPLFQDSGLLSVITDHIHIPVTLFWPTDKALQALPLEQQNFLFHQDNKDMLKEYLKFHVIRDTRVVI